MCEHYESGAYRGPRLEACLRHKEKRFERLVRKLPKGVKSALDCETYTMLLLLQPLSNRVKAKETVSWHDFEWASVYDSLTDRVETELESVRGA